MVLTLLGILLFLLIVACFGAWVMNRWTDRPFDRPADTDPED